MPSDIETDRSAFAKVRGALHAGLADIMEADTRRQLAEALDEVNGLERRMRSMREALARREGT